MAAPEGQSKSVNPQEGEEITVVKTSTPVGNDKKKEEPVTNMPMNHKDDVFADWNMAIRG